MESRKRRRRVEKEASPVSCSTSSTSGSDDDGSAFEAAEKGMGNLSSSTSMLLEPEDSGSSGEVEMRELRSKHAHDKGGSRSHHVRRPKKRGDGPVTELRPKKVQHRGGVGEVKSRMGRRSSAKCDNVEGKGELVRGKKGKAVAEKGKVVGNEGEGVGDVVLRHRCALEAVCGLNSELAECQKLAIEGTVWGPVLRYKSFDMDRHLVRALVESWVPETRSFRIGRREVPFSMYDVALLTSLPARGRQVVFEEGQGAGEVEEVVKAAMDDHLARERARRQTGRADMRMYRNYVSVIVDLCKENNTPERLGLFTKLYALLVMSGLLFPRTTGGVAWELTGMTEDVSAMAEYNWSEAV